MTNITVLDCVEKCGGCVESKQGMGAEGGEDVMFVGQTEKKSKQEPRTGAEIQKAKHNWGGLRFFQNSGVTWQFHPKIDSGHIKMVFIADSQIYSNCLTRCRVQDENINHAPTTWFAPCQLTQINPISTLTPYLGYINSAHHDQYGRR